MILVINGQCIYCGMRIRVQRVDENEPGRAYKNIVYHASCEREQQRFLHDMDTGLGPLEAMLDKPYVSPDLTDQP